MFNFKDTKSYRVVTIAGQPNECMVRALGSSKPARGIKRLDIALGLLSALERGFVVNIEKRDGMPEGSTTLLVLSPEFVAQLREEVDDG